MSFASVQSAEYADQLLKQGKAEDINQKPVGTGPRSRTWWQPSRRCWRVCNGG